MTTSSDNKFVKSTSILENSPLILPSSNMCIYVAKNKYEMLLFLSKSIIIM